MSMIIKLRDCAAGVCCMVLVACALHAQETRTEQGTGRTLYLRYFVGGYGALGINLHNAGFGALPGVPSCCSEYRDATALLPVVAALFEIPVIRDLRIQARVGYSSLNGVLKRQEAIGNEPVLTDGPIPTQQRADIQVEHTLDVTAPMLVIEPTVGYRFLDFFWVSAGVRGGMVLSSSYEQKETLFTPDGYTFLDGTTVRNESTGAIPNLQSFQVHAVVGLGYELLTQSTFSLVPEVRYYLPITQVSTVDWAVSAFQLGVSFRYGVYSPKDPTIIRDTVVSRDTSIVEKPNLRNDNVYLASANSEDSTRDEGDVRFITTHIHETYIRETPRPFSPEIFYRFQARDEQGRMVAVDTIHVEEQDVIENYPLLPQVFFAHGSSSLDSTSQLRLDPEQAREFRTMDLMRNQLDVYRNMLNVVGSRLRKDPSATITLVGYVDNVDEEKNNRELAEARAEAVRDYLVTAFNIESERIKVIGRGLPSSPANPTTPDGQAENRRVEITASDPAILAPVEFRDKDLVITPQQFVITPAVTGGEDIASWETSVGQGASVLVSNNGSGAPTQITWDPNSASSRPRNDKPIVATVTVRNEIGQTRVASDTLNVDYVTSQLMKAREEGGKLIERYSLIVFEFNSAQLSAENQRVMNQIKSRIQPESKVRIFGYADRQGNPEYNRTLARKRCLEAQRVLGLPDNRVTIEPVGSDRLLFDNDIPEGRSYSRTVQIEIETPVR